MKATIMKAIMKYDGDFAGGGNEVTLLSVSAERVRAGYVAAQFRGRTFQCPWWFVRPLDADAETQVELARAAERLAAP
jgi:hypothetical protein